jgi:hypothetical protein
LSPVVCAAACRQTAWRRRHPTVKRVFLPGAELGLTGELLLWAKDQYVADYVERLDQIADSDAEHVHLGEIRRLAERCRSGVHTYMRFYGD